MPVTLSARAILFDMDGTLVNSDGAVRHIWANFAERFGLDLDEIQKTSHGVKMIETINQWAPRGTDGPALERELQALELLDVEGTAPVPGAAEFRASLPRDRVALVTSATLPLAHLRMQLCGIELPNVVVTAEDVSAGKPNPECYRLAASRPVRRSSSWGSGRARPPRGSRACTTMSASATLWRSHDTPPTRLHGGGVDRGRCGAGCVLVLAQWMYADP